MTSTVFWLAIYAVCSFIFFSLFFLVRNCNNKHLTQWERTWLTSAAAAARRIALMTCAVRWHGRMQLCVTATSSRGVSLLYHSCRACWRHHVLLWSTWFNWSPLRIGIWLEFCAMPYSPKEGSRVIQLFDFSVSQAPQRFCRLSRPLFQGFPLLA